MIREHPEVTEHRAEVASGQRFEFGKNWASFLETVNEERIVEAKKSLMMMLDTVDLKGKAFLDAGCEVASLASLLGSWAPLCIPSTTTQTPFCVRRS